MILGLLIVYLSLSTFSSSSTENDKTSCPLQKGDQGVPGHRGPQGLRGYKGEKGSQGSSGKNGNKGDEGAKGLQGPPGKQGSPGVVGPRGPQGDQGSVGPQGPPGDTGIQGITGIQGVKGQKGIQGIKGERGSSGPRGRDGIDGHSGLPGHTGTAGPKGPKGDKGERGLPGHRGERGLQGVPGPDMDDEILKKLKNQIVEELKSTIRSAIRPVAYLVGDGSGWRNYNGQVFTQWSTSTSGSRPSVLQGGMTYSNGYITVPETGIYFIYFNLYANGLSSPGYRNPAIYIDGTRIGFSIFKFRTTDSQSQYLGLLWKVNKGSKLSVRAGGGSMEYAFPADWATFGAWRVD